MSTTVESSKPAWARELPDCTPNGDPIVYGLQPLGPRIVDIIPQDNNRLLVTFDDDETRQFDLCLLLSRGVFQKLKDPEAFHAVEVVNGRGGAAWASGPDLSAETLYHRGAKQ